MGNYTNDKEVFSRLGLNREQTRIMFSIERLMVEKNIAQEKDATKRKLKTQWLNEWTNAVETGLAALGTELIIPSSTVLYDSEQIVERIRKIYEESPENNTWYYLIMLEATLFVPYTPIGSKNSTEESLKEDAKAYKDLKYSTPIKFLKGLVDENHIMDSAYIDRFQKTYQKSIMNAKGLTTRIAVAVAIALVATAISLGIAAVFAPAIAATLVGGNFVGLSGIALTNASLAFLGGGAIAAGGAGIAGGTAVIVGGAALLGGAVGSSVGGAYIFLSSSPDFALSQAAKLEVVIKEILLNAQKDIKFAQIVMEDLRHQIFELNNRLTKMELSNMQSKEEIKNLKTTISYMEKVFNENNKFFSSFKEGMKSEKFEI